MFEPISQSLYEIMMFSVLGFFLAALYEPLRIARIFVKTSAVWVSVQDLLFLSLCGVTVFAYSLEFGAGYFRFFYIIGLAFGAAVYFLTAGRVIVFVFKRFSDAIKVRIIRPLRKLLVKVAQKIKHIFVRVHKNAEKHSKALKNTAQIKYNSMTVLKKNRKMSKGDAPIASQRKPNEVQRRVVKATIINRIGKA